MPTKRVRVRLAAMALAVFSAAWPAGSAEPAPAPRLAPSQPIPPAELEALADGAVRQADARDHVGGVSVAVVQNGQVIFEKGYGYADIDAGRRVDPETTLFRIASITKTFTWLMALEAVNGGRLSLDVPIDTALPPSLRIPAQGFSRAIRLRDLMTHTPGFEDQVLKGLFFHDPAQIQPLDVYLAAHRPARVYPPGEVSAYSNYGAALAGAAVAQVEKRPWQDLLEAEILRPAGLDHTTGREPYPPRAGLPAPMPASLARDLSRAYRWTGVRYAAQPYEYSGVAPADAISSTAGDVARYMTLLLNGGVIDGRTIYGPATAAAIRTPMFAYPGGAAVDAGVFQTPMRGGFLAFGHDGGTIDFHAAMTLIPDLRLGVFVASNTESGQTLVWSLAPLIVSRFYAPPAAPLSPSPGLMRQAGAYRGEFQSTRRPFHGLEAFMMSVLSTPVAVASPGYLMVGAERFVPSGRPGLFQDVDDPPTQMQAVMADGRATRLIAASGELWRRDFVHQTRTLVVMTALTALSGLGVLGGLFSLARWRLPQSRLQRLAGSLRGAAALLWLCAIATFVVKLSQALGDRSTLAFGWPGPLILIASSAALAASCLSWATAAATPLIWADRDGWDPWRKLRFTATVMVFSAFGLLLAMLGALQPWNP